MFSEAVLQSQRFLVNIGEGLAYGGWRSSLLGPLCQTQFHAWYIWKVERTFQKPEGLAFLWLSQNSTCPVFLFRDQGLSFPLPSICPGTCGGES